MTITSAETISTPDLIPTTEDSQSAWRPEVAATDQRHRVADRDERHRVADTDSPVCNKSKAARCRHFKSDGSRCRLAALDNGSNLCFRHHSLLAANLQPVNDRDDLSPDLLPQPSDFSDTGEIHAFLTRLLGLVTKGRISPRRASVLAYITNQLLHSQRVIAKEIADQPTQFIVDMPRPNYD